MYLDYPQEISAQAPAHRSKARSFQGAKDSNHCTAGAGREPAEIATPVGISGDVDVQQQQPYDELQMCIRGARGAASDPQKPGKMYMLALELLCRSRGLVPGVVG